MEALVVLRTGAGEITLPEGIHATQKASPRVKAVEASREALALLARLEGVLVFETGSDLRLALPHDLSAGERLFALGWARRAGGLAVSPNQGRTWDAPGQTPPGLPLEAA